MLSLMLFYILLGAVMDELAMILLTLPVFFLSCRRSISACRPTRWRSGSASSC